KSNYLINEAESVKSAEISLDTYQPDIVLLDVKLASESGLAFLPEIVSRPNPPLVIVITAHGSERLAVEALKKGAYNYLAKPFDLDELRLQVLNATETIQLRRENTTLK